MPQKPQIHRFESTEEAEADVHAGVSAEQEHEANRAAADHLLGPDTTAAGVVHAVHWDIAMKACGLTGLDGTTTDDAAVTCPTCAKIIAHTVTALDVDQATADVVVAVADGVSDLR